MRFWSGDSLVLFAATIRCQGRISKKIATPITRTSASEKNVMTSTPLRSASAFDPGGACASRSRASARALTRRFCLPLSQRRRPPRHRPFGAPSRGPHARCLRFAPTVARVPPRGTQDSLPPGDLLLGRRGLSPRAALRSFKRYVPSSPARLVPAHCDESRGRRRRRKRLALIDDDERNLGGQSPGQALENIAAHQVPECAAFGGSHHDAARAQALGRIH